MSGLAFFLLIAVAGGVLTFLGASHSENAKNGLLCLILGIFLLLFGGYGIFTAFL